LSAMKRIRLGKGRGLADEVGQPRYITTHFFTTTQKARSFQRRASPLEALSSSCSVRLPRRLMFHVFTLHYAIFVPQLGQNWEPSGTSALQLGQIISPPILPPHWGQNFDPAGI